MIDTKKIPLHTDITVLPADDPKGAAIGFVVRERLGAPIGRALDENGRPVHFGGDLVVGETVLVPGYEILHTMVVHASEEGGGFVARFPDGSGSIAFLSFGDDQFDPCWCVTCWVNPRGLKQLRKSSL
jgi:hypothetical protein